MSTPFSSALPPAIDDVAVMAGVSNSTISRVLGGNFTYMRPATRQRVQQAIRELGYRPSSAARRLTIHCNSSYDLAHGTALLQALIDRRADGILLMSSSMSDEWLNILKRVHFPVVVLDWEVCSSGQSLVAIGVDFKSGIHAAVKHLLAPGHRPFAYISGRLFLHTSRERREAFLQALRAAGIPSSEVPVIEGNNCMDGGRQAMADLLDSLSAPTAVFAANDLMAIGARAAARAAGLRLPHQLSVIGLDDIWLAEQVEPPLTTVALPRYKIGFLATRMLISRISASQESTAGPEYN